MLVSCVGATFTGAEREKVAQAKRCAHVALCADVAPVFPVRLVVHHQHCWPAFSGEPRP